ncbi:MAG: hypothetical protein AAB459_03860 [Patescibacteria group bacterium]
MKKLIINLSILVFGFLPVILPAVAFAENENPFSKVCNQQNEDEEKPASNSFVCNESAKDPSAQDGIIVKATNIVAYIGGIAAIIIIMVGGFSYVMSSGDSSKINKAKDMILFALVGLVIIVFARTIIVFVVSKL